ncbi:hypothetical protein B0J13DRAFT_531080 [Dactylonectria estremocensis]|uniref:Uncharacterized protein n=1 Tax=Dactylonectria estremocensis TaxID=1079267 RepID=A0A9P9DWJ3_9HYPO|nr:hypothetical protein B0J13DRAFT_531080 [Dactylonectria estremocensis]
MRRWLWITVAEILLDSSIDAGQPPLLSLDDFDCALPSNFNDDQLIPGSNAHPVPYPDSHLRVYGCLSQLGLLSGVNGPGAFVVPAALSLLGHFSLHLRFAHPFCVGGAEKPGLLLLTKGSLDAALKLAYAILPPKSSQEPLMAVIQEAWARRSKLSPIVDQGSYIPRFRTIVASSSLQPGSIQEIELRLFLDGAVAWAKSCILPGRENTKDYIYLFIVSGSIQGAINGVPVEVSMRVKALETLGQAKGILRQISGGESPRQDGILPDTDCESNVVVVLSADDAVDLDWVFFDTSTQDGFLWAGASDFSS